MGVGIGEEKRYQGKKRRKRRDSLSQFGLIVLNCSKGGD